MESRKGKSEADVQFDTDLHGDVETDSTGKNVLIRDPDTSIDTSELEILEYSPPNESKSEESSETEQTDKVDPYDPYNSGIFDMSDEEKSKSREWKTKRRK